MKDRFQRTVDYLRVSVTDCCNLRCHYCYPCDLPSEPQNNRRLSLTEIVAVVSTALDMGVTRVRLTGGEPLVRKDMVQLVGRLAPLRGLLDLALTTNGQLLRHLARPLAAAGLQRINVHLDTLDSERYRKITGGGDLRETLFGLELARVSGITPVKINCVVAFSSDEPDAREVAKYAKNNGYEVRFIRRMNLKSGAFSIVDGGNGGDCPRCNRLRLTSVGMVRPCLFSDLAFDVRRLGARAAFERAVALKPKAGTVCHTQSFYAIGG